MCAILDANVVSEVFRRNRSPRGEQFAKWLFLSKRGCLVVGGQLRTELAAGNPDCRDWLNEAERSGRRALFIDDDDVQRETEKIRDRCASNDAHIIALARVSRARLLFSDDKDLHGDFCNKRLLDQPRGKIYSSEKHRRLLKCKELC